jgi:hypothetical protein
MFKRALRNMRDVLNMRISLLKHKINPDKTGAKQ